MKLEERIKNTMSVLIPFLPLKMQAKMADPLIRAFKDEISPGELLLEIERNFNEFKNKVDACITIANVAYIVVNTDDMKVKEKGKQIIERYKNFILAETLKILNRIEDEINKLPKEAVKEKFFEIISKYENKG